MNQRNNRNRRGKRKIRVKTSRVLAVSRYYNMCGQRRFYHCFFLCLSSYDPAVKQFYFLFNFSKDNKLAAMISVL